MDLEGECKSKTLDISSDHHSLRNNFDSPVDEIKENADILVV